MSKTFIVKKIASIAIMETISVAAMFILLLVLKLFQIEGGMFTRVVPFLTLLTCTAIYYFVVDQGSFRLRSMSKAVPSIILFISIALIPAFMDKAFLSNLPHRSLDYRWLPYYLLVAVAEELFFRAYICYHLRGLKKWYRILTSAVAFACLHFISSEEMTLLLFLLLILFGIVFAFTYENIKSIVPLIGFHLVWNFMADYSDHYSNMLIVIAIWILLLVSSFLLKHVTASSAIIDSPE